MELRAVIEGLRRLKRPCRVHLVSDSQYTVFGITRWLPEWKRRAWRRREGRSLRPVRNADLWQQIDELLGRHHVTCEHVEAHAGHPENERCDELAVLAARRAVEEDAPDDLDPLAEACDEDNCPEAASPIQRTTGRPSS